RPWQRMNSKSFDRRLSEAQVVFWADFHGVRQYPRNLLRHLENQKPEFFLNGFVLGLECLPISKQKWIDEFLNHQISEEEFLEKVEWKENWGFPWEHYRPLVLMAKQSGFRVLALNKTGPNTSLSLREKAASQILQNEAKKNPQARIWVLFGEFHLLPGGFPKFWKERSRTEFILQNFDDLYFKLPPKNHNSSAEFLRLGNEYLCVQAVAPWIKWQSYLLFLETQAEFELDEGIEVSDHLFDVAKAMANEMQWKCLPQWFHAYRAEDHVLWQKMKAENSQTKKLFERFVQEQLSFTSFSHSWSYLSRLSSNEVGALAFLILWHYNCSHLSWPADSRLSRESWLQLTWIFAWSYFGSKLHNPHRRTPSLLDIQAQAKKASRPFERQAARLVIHLTLQEQTGRVSNIFEGTPSDRVRFLGLTWRAGLLGEKIYSAYREGKINQKSLKLFLSKKPGTKHFFEVWQSLEELIS
ncbi:MAG: ChaN family lipoprotein, partial [Bdellovibrionales bacterium]